jgi:hypothetical protein
LRSESIRTIRYLYEDAGPAEYDGYGGWVAEHYSVRTVALDGSVLLVQALADDVEVVFVMHVPHEPEVCPCCQGRTGDVSETQVL